MTDFPVAIDSASLISLSTILLICHKGISEEFGNAFLPWLRHKISHSLPSPGHMDGPLAVLAASRCNYDGNLAHAMMEGK